MLSQNRDSSPFGALITVLSYDGTNSGGNDTDDVVLSARLEKNSQAFMKLKMLLASPITCHMKSRNVKGRVILGVPSGDGATGICSRRTVTFSEMAIGYRVVVSAWHAMMNDDGSIAKGIKDLLDFDVVGSSSKRFRRREQCKPIFSAFEKSRLLVVQLAANALSDHGCSIYQRFLAPQLLHLPESNDEREAIAEVVFRRRWIQPCPALRRAAEELVFIVDAFRSVREDVILEPLDVVPGQNNRDSSPFGSLITVLSYDGTNSGGNEDTDDVVLSARLEKNSQAFMKRKIQLASPITCHIKSRNVRRRVILGVPSGGGFTGICSRTVTFLEVAIGYPVVG
nr:uncharacterized protein LOC109166700 [Ipomoea batatas]